MEKGGDNNVRNVRVALNVLQIDEVVDIELSRLNDD